MRAYSGASLNTLATTARHAGWQSGMTWRSLTHCVRFGSRKTVRNTNTAALSGRGRPPNNGWNLWMWYSAWEEGNELALAAEQRRLATVLAEVPRYGDGTDCRGRCSVDGYA